MNRSIVFLGGGIDSLGIIGRAVEMGLFPIVVDQDKDCPARNLAGRYLQASCYSKYGAWGELTLIHKALDPSAVLCAGTDAPDVMADIAQNYGLVGPSSHTARLSIDKVAQKKRLKEFGVPVPRFIEVPASFEGGYRFAATFGPSYAGLVVKPADSRGARGVLRMNGKDELMEAIPASLAHSPTQTLIIERWIHGIQLSSESLVQDGKILWTAFAERNYDRLEEFAPYVIEDGSDMPPDIPTFYEKDWRFIANQTLQKCVDALGLIDGTLKGDLVWNGDGVWVIEVATRLSGGRFCSDMIPNVWGVDFVGMAIRIALGERIYGGEIRPYLRRHACQRFYFPPDKEITCHPDRGEMAIGYGPNREHARQNAELRLRRATQSQPSD
jgi:predicted ATP-grasp superfamily ATP-dependent carboligase